MKSGANELGLGDYEVKCGSSRAYGEGLGQWWRESMSGKEDG